MIGETRHFGGFHTILAKLDMSSFANHDCSAFAFGAPCPAGLFLVLWNFWCFTSGIS